MKRGPMAQATKDRIRTTLKAKRLALRSTAESQPGSAVPVRFINIPAQLVREYPVTSVRAWDPESIRGAVISTSQGRWQDGSDLARAMHNDPAWAAARERRLNGLLRTPIAVTPYDDTPLSKFVAAAVERRLPDMLDEMELRAVVGWYHDLSVGLGTVDWSIDDDCDEMVPHLRSLNPRWLYYDFSRYVYYFNARDGIIDVSPGDGRWFLVSSWRPGQYAGKVSETANLWGMKRFAENDWNVWSDSYADPIIKAYYPNGGTNDAANDSIAAYISQVFQAKGSKVVGLPRGTDENNSYDIDALQVDNNAWQGFKERIEYADRKIQISWLGGNLSSEVDGGGSYAASQVHHGVERELVQGDAQVFAQALTRQLVRLYVTQNFGALVPCPCVGWNIEVEEDAAGVAKTMSDVATAIKTLGDAGYEADEAELSERFGFTIRKKAPSAAAAAPTQPTDNSGDTAKVSPPSAE